MKDFEVAIAVAEAGAAVVRHRFGTALQRLDKGKGDFATNADVEAENAMLVPAASRAAGRRRPGRGERPKWRSPEPAHMADRSPLWNA